jgi:hypothetical protein
VNTLRPLSDISGQSLKIFVKEIPMPPLDGTEVVKPVPFDAHEQFVRTPSAPGDEYPKAVDHVDHPSGVGLQPVVVNSAEEEEAYKAAKAAEAAKSDKAE